MSTETRALIQSYYDAFNRADMESFFALLSDDVIHDINQGQQEVGLEPFRAFMQRMNQHYREQIRDLVVLCDDSGERAAAEFMVHGEYLTTDTGLPEAKGQTYQLPAGAFFAVKAGKITRISNFYNLNDWVAQVEA